MSYSGGATGSNSYFWYDYICVAVKSTFEHTSVRNKIIKNVFTFLLFSGNILPGERVFMTTAISTIGLLLPKLHFPLVQDKD